jgi:hypothetical protein
MGSTKLHRVRSGQRHTRRSGGRWLGERRFARWRPNLGGHVSSLAAYPGKRSIWGSSPDPYDSAGADGDLSIINNGYSDTSRHLIEKGLQETLSPVTSHSAALLNLQMPFRLCCSARQQLQHNHLHVRRRGRTQRCEVPQHDCAPKRHVSSDLGHPGLRHVCRVDHH